MIINSQITTHSGGNSEAEAIMQQGFLKVDKGWLNCKEGWAYFSGTCCNEDKSNYTINPSSATSIRQIVRFKLNSIPANDNNCLMYSINQAFYALQIKSGGKPNARLYNGHQTTNTLINYTLSTGVWYYLAVRWDNHTTTLALYDDDGTRLGYATTSDWSLWGQNDTPTIGGRNASSYSFTAGITDIAHCCVEVNGTVGWGVLTTKMQDMGIIS